MTREEILKPRNLMDQGAVKTTQDEKQAKPKPAPADEEGYRSEFGLRSGPSIVPPEQ